MNNKTTEHNPGASDSARLFNSYFPSLFLNPTRTTRSLRVAF
jgi:hypothetical protein